MINFPNILAEAMKVIGFVDFDVRTSGRETITDIGTTEDSFGEWQTVRGMIQPGVISSFGGKNITEKDYKQMGLDWTKQYYTIWCNKQLHTTSDDTPADQVKWNGIIMNVCNTESWGDLNGWCRAYCAEAKNEY